MSVRMKPKIGLQYIKSCLLTNFGNFLFNLAYKTIAPWQGFLSNTITDVLLISFIILSTSWLWQEKSGTARVSWATLIASLSSVRFYSIGGKKLLLKTVQSCPNSTKFQNLAICLAWKWIFEPSEYSSKQNSQLLNSNQQLLPGECFPNEQTGSSYVKLHGLRVLHLCKVKNFKPYSMKKILSSYFYLKHTFGIHFHNNQVTLANFLQACQKKYAREAKGSCQPSWLM